MEGSFMQYWEVAMEVGEKGVNALCFVRDSTYISTYLEDSNITYG
jgi:hypothetical protein